MSMTRSGSISWGMRFAAGPDERGVAVGHRARQEVDHDLVGAPDLVVDACLDPLPEIGRHALEREVEAAPQGLHVPSGDRDPVVRPDHAAQHVQRGVGAHEAEPAVPVDLPPQSGPGWRELVDVERVPDRAPFTPYAVTVSVGGPVVQRAEVARLPAAARVEGGAVQSHPRSAPGRPRRPTPRTPCGTHPRRTARTRRALAEVAVFPVHPRDPPCRETACHGQPSARPRGEAVAG